VLLQPRQLSALRPGVSILRDCRVEGMQQIAVSKRARQEVGRYRLDGAHERTNIVVIRDEGSSAHPVRATQRCRSSPAHVGKIPIQDRAGRRVGLVTVRYSDASERDSLQAAGNDERVQLCHG
jgi:hypothetical protein